VDGDALEALRAEAVEEPTQLASCADRVHGSDRKPRERLEQLPPTRADGEAASAQIRANGLAHSFGQPDPRALEVEHELGLRRGRAQQLGQEEPRAPRRREPPAVPENRQRADRLQVPNLEAPVIEPDVSLDERAAEQLRCAEVVDAVAGPVGDQERSPRRLGPGIRGEGQGHDQRV
jgi:hypothetical protein